MDAQALEAAAWTKAELDVTEELTRALRATRYKPMDGPDPEPEAVFDVARRIGDHLHAAGAPEMADRLEAEIFAAADTALAVHSYRLRIKLLRAGVHV
ncbi:hypothetical protein BHAOGJBA_0749 [Methylobacterium hispanicum]|uniref:Uncharacterized protein n=1 Tax=Methylobacterium hispanicum TaxID=270350 RepID=A0AAV4ZGN2_9HYPH|nr:hypothetical protein [Methylobacterium hispanicum]GJD87249.1 hypothetical protein BHAOGJBA_0749 [Methylobacterium hispanicum]